MATNKILNEDFILEKDRYLSFDATTLKTHIINRLNEAGVTTDQNFAGSNLAVIIDIVAYTFHVLMFYLNKTSTETIFTDAQIYENMNRIVKMLDYKPIGKQTATLSFSMSALGTSELSNVGLFTIPRYSYIDVNGIVYSFNEDITFSKTIVGQTEELTDIMDQKLLYQGAFEEYPVYNAIGDENEIIFLTPGDNVNIDHFNIHIYIKQNNTYWEKWESTPSLYLESAYAKKYEIRLNENKHYEIKFGNNINGIKLNPNDQVAIYYLRTEGSNGEVGTNSLLGKSLITYSTVQYNEILNDVNDDQYTYLNDTSLVQFDNNMSSTYADNEESVDDIRQNAPGIFRSQYRLVTESDYENYVKTNFANLIHDIKVANNWKYLSEELKYYYDLGISQPNQISRILYNQVTFGDACNFNNVYLTIIPKIVSNTNPIIMLSPSQKELIISSMKSEKLLTSEIVILDPVYIAVGLGLPLVGNIININDTNNTELLVIKDPNSRRDSTSIKNDINNIFVNCFTRSNVGLGQTIDVKELTSQILSVNGVSTFYTQRKDDNSVRYEGLSLVAWNPIYTNDITQVLKNLVLSYFKFPYLYNQNNFSNNVIVQSTTKIYEGVEY